MVFAFAVGCQSKAPSPTVTLHLDRPGTNDAVQFRSLHVISDIKWTSANHFEVKLQLTEGHTPTAIRENIFSIEEMRFFVNGGGSWFRDRFGLKLTVSGHWQGTKDDAAVFEAYKFVAYPHEIAFRPEDSKATTWLQDEVQGLWHDLLRQIASAR